MLLHRSRDTTINSYWKNIQPKLVLGAKDSEMGFLLKEVKEREWL
jgi:hypothetical protein